MVGTAPNPGGERVETFMKKNKKNAKLCALGALCCALAAPLAWASPAGTGVASSAGLSVSVVVLPHCFEVKSPEEPGLARLLASKRLLCAGSSGMGDPVRVEAQPDGSLLRVPGAPNTLHRAGAS